MKQSLQYHENQLTQMSRNIEYLSKRNYNPYAIVAIWTDYANLKKAIDKAIAAGLDEFDAEEVLNGKN